MAANIAKLPKPLLRKRTTGPPSPAPGGPFVVDEWLKLLLFDGFAGLHVNLITFSPSFPTLHATGAPRVTTLGATCAPLVAPFHTGRCWSGGCWSRGCWSDWLCLSLSI